MSWSRWLLCMGVGGLIGVSVFAETEQEPLPAVEAPGANELEGLVPADAAAINNPVAEDVVAEEQGLRRQYLQLIEQQAGLMDRSALRNAISRAERDIDELRAEQKLQRARQLLLELVKAHAGTTAAGKARSMLQADSPSGFVAPYGAVDPINGGRSFQPIQPTPDSNATHQHQGVTPQLRDVFPGDPEPAFEFEQSTPSPSDTDVIKPDTRKRGRTDPLPKPLDVELNS